MTLQPPSIDQDALTLGNIPHGSSKMVQQVISNRTQQPILWRIDTCGTNWLSVDRKTGSLQPGEQQTINVTVDTNSLEAGSHTATDRKSTRLNSSHLVISYAVFCLKKKKKTKTNNAT